MALFLTVDDYRKQAEKKLTRVARDYYNGASEEERSLNRNESAYSDLLIRPRCLNDVSSVRTSSDWLGARQKFPIGIAPTAFHRMADEEGEINTCRGAAASGSLMIASSWSTVPLEKMAAETKENGGQIWFQLYVYKDMTTTMNMVRRAERAGCTAIVLTVDTPVLGRRLADLRNAFTLPAPLSLANYSDIDNKCLPQEEGESGLMKYVSSQIDSSLNWETLDMLKKVSSSKRAEDTINFLRTSEYANTPNFDLEQIADYCRRSTHLPILIKGVMRSDDAVAALLKGVDGIIVSNHGGRQLDGTPGTIEVLPEIVRAVQGKCPVFVDGGIRNGRDVFKAIALGARGVFVGRPVIWGLSVKGAQGVQNVMNILQSEFKHTMQLAGCRSIEEMQHCQDLIVHKSYYSKL